LASLCSTSAASRGDVASPVAGTDAYLSSPATQTWRDHPDLKVASTDKDPLASSMRTRKARAWWAAGAAAALCAGIGWLAANWRAPAPSSPPAALLPAELRMAKPMRPPVPSPSLRGEMLLVADQLEVAGAEVFVDGRKKAVLSTADVYGPAPFPLETGRHELRVVQAGYREFSHVSTLEEGCCERVAVHLDRAEPAVVKGSRSLGADPTETASAGAQGQRQRINVVLADGLSTSPVVSAALFPPDGHAITFATCLGEACFWDISKRTTRRIGFDSESDPASRTNHCVRLAFSPDGTLLAQGGASPRVRLWRVSTGTMLNALETGLDFVQQLAFSPDGKRLAVMGPRGGKIFSTDAFECVHTLEALGSDVHAVFSSDGTWLACGQIDGAIRLLKTADWSLLKVLQAKPDHGGGPAPITGLSCGPFASLASISAEGKVTLWDVEAGKPRWSSSTRAATTGSAGGMRRHYLAWGPQGILAASGPIRGQLRLFDSARGEEVFSMGTHFDDVQSVDFSPDGRWLVTRCPFRKSIGRDK
jgi:hypothetical protein